jgi:capsular polysaccharide biosynthesis protein
MKMELREIIKKMKKNKLAIVTPMLVGLLAGLAFYAMPSKYISSGSIYVRRKVSEQTDFFTYEGYYAQQTALGYTDSVSNLIESSDIKKMLLEKSGEAINTIKLLDLQRKVKVKKTGPQLILLEIKEKTPEEAKEKWMSLTDIVILKSQEINMGGDKEISLGTLSKEPLIRETYKNPYIFSLVGSLIGLTLGLIFLSLREYLKE